MQRIVLFLVAAVVSVVGSTSRGDLITLDFEGFATGEFVSGSEDGFLLQNIAGSSQILSLGSSFPPLSGNRLSSIDQVNNAPNVIRVTEGDGSIFSFLSVDGRWNGTQVDQTIRVEGFRLGASVGVDIFDVSTGAATFSASNLSGVAVDQLEFTLTAVSSSPGPQRTTYMDNIVLNSVPEPGSGGMLVLVGTLSCLFARPKRARRG